MFGQQICLMTMSVLTQIIVHSNMNNHVNKMNIKKCVHVAVGVIFHDCEAQEFSANNVPSRQILIAKRAEHQHQGGLWEFPGGKVEEGETVPSALNRELEEELGLSVSVNDMSPLISIPFEYSDKSVLLDVWMVKSSAQFYKQTNFGHSSPEIAVLGRENQPLRWVSQLALSQFKFPAANQAIIAALSDMN